MLELLNMTIGFSWEWPRPANGKGFFWHGSGEDQDILITRLNGAAFENYRPFEDAPELFRTFADLEPTVAAALEFANRYGDIGMAHDFACWKQKIDRMKYFVGVWDSLRAQDWPKLRTLLLRVPRERRIGDRGKPDDLVDCAATLLFRELGGGTFNWVFGNWSRNPPRVKWIAKNNLAEMQFSPPNLWFAMYAQFLVAFTGNKKFQRCDACSKWFELKPSLNRADRQTCSDSCRVKLYRQRQQHARELHAKGMSVQKIAKEIGSEIPIIKKWLQKRKGK